MKKRFLFLFVLLSTLFIGGCKGETEPKTALSAPQSVVVRSDGNTSLIVFDEVSNAEYYNIYINDMAVTVRATGSGTITYDASKIISEPQKYTIKVKAGGDKYLDSEFSSTYEYAHTSVLETPVATIDGTTLNWTKIQNADLYDVVVTTSTSPHETTHRFASNKFDFSNILVNRGIYTFKVQAISEDSQYKPSAFSNEAQYVNVVTLDTPTSLQCSYPNNELLLTCVANEGVESFIINVNGVNHELSEANLSTYTQPNDFDNVYIFKLTSFLGDKNVSLDPNKMITIKLKATSNTPHILNSGFSKEINYQFKSMLAKPSISLTKGSNNSTIKFTVDDISNIGSYDVYLNNEKYTSVPGNINIIELPNSVIDNKGIRIQAISNNNNVVSSCFSNAVYSKTENGELLPTEISFDQNNVSWASVDNAEGYLVEVYNKTFRYGVYTTETTINLSTICAPNVYNVKVIAMANGYTQSEIEKSVEITAQLAQVSNININTNSNSAKLTFDKVENAHGYLMYLNDERVNHVFTENEIDINSYVDVAKSYTITLQAISLTNQYVLASDLSQGQQLQNVKTLSAPLITLDADPSIGKYDLIINVDEEEAKLARGYSIWINYELFGTYDDFRDDTIDISSRFSSAGKYHIMIKALADENNPYVKDSNIYNLPPYTYTKQLDIVQDIKVEQKVEESRYILTFKEQNLVAKYIVTIERLGSDPEEFETNSGFVDITEYLKENGIYKIYVKAVALAGSYYTDSADTGNPYRITKGLTLNMASNIKVEKVKAQTAEGDMAVKWDKVDNAIGYKVNIYYVENGQERLRKSIQTSNTEIKGLGSGSGKCFNKEGSYIIKIKSLGDSEEYEDSQYASYSYTYTMETVADFTRNSVFMYGKEYNYYVSSYEQLQHLLWYHYLYNNQVWNYSAQESYNIKIYCDANLDNLAKKASDELYNKISSLSGNQEKMAYLGQVALSQYPENAYYTLGLADAQGYEIQQFCINKGSNVYLFRYEDKLDKDKTKTVSTDNQISFPHVMDLVDEFDKRPSNYVFAIDNLNSIDVETTEQLFMAVQYNKKPNFVGSSAVAQTVYENARNILRQICDDSMTDYEKVLQIYDYLTTQVATNTSTSLNGGAGYEISSTGGKTSLGNLKYYYLESVFYDLDNQVAVCDGLAKSFVLMCAIEGIEAIKVKGTVGNINHAWNKVYVDVHEGDEGEGVKAWYNIDTTLSRTKYTFSSLGVTYEVGTHKYFLATDAELGYKQTFSHKGNISAETKFDYYTDSLYSAQYKEETISGNKSLNTETDFATQFKNYLKYGLLKTNKNGSLNKRSILLDMNIGAYTGDLQTLTGTNLPAYYATIRGELNNNYTVDFLGSKVDGNILVILLYVNK